MWHDIFTVLSVINLAIAVIALVGFLTYADYITNLNPNHKMIYCIFEGICFAVTLEFSILQWIFKDFSAAIDAGISTLGICSFVALIVIGICFLFHLLSKTREYFGKKRNKI